MSLTVFYWCLNIMKKKKITSSKKNTYVCIICFTPTTVKLSCRNYIETYFLNYRNYYHVNDTKIQKKKNCYILVTRKVSVSDEIEEDRRKRETLRFREECVRRIIETDRSIFVVCFFYFLVGKRQIVFVLFFFNDKKINNSKPEPFIN